MSEAVRRALIALNAATKRNTESVQALQLAVAGLARSGSDIEQRLAARIAACESSTSNGTLASMLEEALSTSSVLLDFRDELAATRAAIRTPVTLPMGTDETKSSREYDCLSAGDFEPQVSLSISGSTRTTRCEDGTYEITKEAAGTVRTVVLPDASLSSQTLGAAQWIVDGKPSSNATLEQSDLGTVLRFDPPPEGDELKILLTYQPSGNTISVPVRILPGRTLSNGYVYPVGAAKYMKSFDLPFGMIAMVEGLQPGEKVYLFSPVSEEVLTPTLTRLSSGRHVIGFPKPGTFLACVASTAGPWGTMKNHIDEMQEIRVQLTQ
jgi:Arc/MetJ-type ribon-helix-helix transcriptional regulator